MCWQNTSREPREVALFFFILWVLIPEAGTSSVEVSPVKRTEFLDVGFARFVHCECMAPLEGVQLRVCFRVTDQ